MAGRGGEAEEPEKLWNCVKQTGGNDERAKAEAIE
jgi:hypothetical protein